VKLCMLVSFKAVLQRKKRHYSRLAKNKVASSQQTESGEGAVEIDAPDQQFSCDGGHAS
jgi:hypothetical protein